MSSGRRRGWLAGLLLSMLLTAGNPLPPATLAAATPHAEIGVRCLDCHVSLPLPEAPLRFHDDLHALCLGCHTDYSCKPVSGDGYFRHPVTVVPPFAMPAAMPLDVKNRMGCITCHIFHDNRTPRPDLHPHLLRRAPGPTFCLTCHEKLPGE